MNIMNYFSDTPNAIFKVAIDKLYDFIQQSCTIKKKIATDDKIQEFSDILNPEEYANEDENIRVRKDIHNLNFWTKLSGFFSSPTHIIDNIYLGSALNAASKTSLEENNIKVVINMAKELTDYYPNDYEYYKCDLYDDNDESVSDHLETIYKYIVDKQWDLLYDKTIDRNTFINNTKNNIIEYSDDDENCYDMNIIDDYFQKTKPNFNKYNGNILIHCYMGASRSAIVAVYYLVLSKGFSIDSAIKYIINKRPHVNPTFRFVKDIAKTIKNKN